MTSAGDPEGECDLAVVGAGIVGLAVARELKARRPEASVTVLERESQVGFHQTAHNSGVIHAGIYYAPGSLKARLCVAGAREMYEFCAEHGVAHERCGKVIVARDASELAGLKALEPRGRENGVDGLRRLGCRGWLCGARAWRYTTLAARRAPASRSSARVGGPTAWR